MNWFNVYMSSDRQVSSFYVYFTVNSKPAWRNAGKKRPVKVKSIDFLVKHKNSWRNPGEIPPGFLHEILQPIIVSRLILYV